MKKNILLCLYVVMPFVFLAGCSEKKEDVASQSPHVSGSVSQEQQQVVSAPARVEVPDDILSAWKAIRVEVIDLVSAKTTAYIVNIGGEQMIGDSGLKIKALNFLPAFQMNVPIITSRSNELENPAAQIEIYEGGNQIFKGWLFTLYPTTHAFTHPKYSITLVEGIAVN